MAPRRAPAAVAAMCGVVIAACAVETSAYNTYYIGNSVTDAIGWDNLDAAGKSMDPNFKWGRHMIPGAPLDWNYSHADECIQHWRATVSGCWRTAFTNTGLDMVSFQPFDRSITDDKTKIGDYLNVLLPKSPNVQIYVYAQYPLNNGTAYATAWLGSGMKTKAAYEGLVTQVRQTYTNIKPCLIVPLGHVFYELDKRMRAGQIPGQTSIWACYSDDIHTSGLGSYVATCTFLATFMKAKPGFSGSPWGITNTATASAIRDCVWDVVCQTPNTGVSVGVRERARIAAERTRGASGVAYGLDGRAVRSDVNANGVRIVARAGQRVATVAR